ncbi:hypothetical protein A3839_22615 [Achromobacter insolitus]|nr:hypothetical protein A3839_22615 [Achromobacter insolitus]
MVRFLPYANLFLVTAEKCFAPFAADVLLRVRSSSMPASRSKALYAATFVVMPCSLSNAVSEAVGMELPTAPSGAEGREFESHRPDQ